MNGQQAQQAVMERGGRDEMPAGLDTVALYRRAVITKIRLRQAIFRARHPGFGLALGRLEEAQAR